MTKTQMQKRLEALDAFLDPAVTALAERLDSLRGVQETVQSYLEEVW